MGHNLLWAAQSSPVWIREHLQPARLPPGGPTGLTPVLSHPAAPHTAPPRKGSLALNAWFLDDGTQVGKLEDLNQVIDILVHEGPAHGLILSTSLTVVPPSTPKSTIWCPTQTADGRDPTGRGIRRVTEEGIILLGAPLGSEAFVGDEVQKKVEKIREITALLPNIEDPHTEFCLLRSCLAFPKLSYLLRTVDTSSHLEHLQEFDRITKEGLIRVLGTPIGERTWQQAKLPVSLGGVGLRQAQDHAPAAHTASILSLQVLMQSMLGVGEEAVQLHQEGEGEDDGELSAGLLAALSAAQGELASKAELVGLTQRQISVKIDLHQHQKLIEDVGEEEVRERARLLSLSLPHAGDWLNTPPLTALGLHLRAAEFILAMKYRLGLPVFDREGPCPACLRHSDILGDHALCCGTGGERISRHNNLRDAFFDTAAQAGLAPVKEGRFLLPGADRRPADVLLHNWVGGLDAAMDVTVVNPLQAATVAGAATTGGHALGHAYDRKMAAGAEDCRSQGIVLLPLAAESLGGWHGAAEKEVKKLAAALARNTGQPEGEAAAHLWGRLVCSCKGAMQPSLETVFPHLLT